MRNASCALIKLGFTDNDECRQASAGSCRNTALALSNHDKVKLPKPLSWLSEVYCR